MLSSDCNFKEECKCHTKQKEKKYNEQITLTGKLVFPNDLDYPSARHDLIQLYQSYPSVIVFVRPDYAIKDIRNALAWSQANDVTIRIRSGRNSTEGWSNTSQMVSFVM